MESNAYSRGVTPGTLLPDRTYADFFCEKSKSIGNLYSTPRATAQLAR